MTPSKHTCNKEVQQHQEALKVTVSHLNQKDINKLRLWILRLVSDTKSFLCLHNCLWVKTLMQATHTSQTQHKSYLCIEGIRIYQKTPEYPPLIIVSNINAITMVWTLWYFPRAYLYSSLLLNSDNSSPNYDALTHSGEYFVPRAVSLWIRHSRSGPSPFNYRCFREEWASGFTALFIKQANSQTL